MYVNIITGTRLRQTLPVSISLLVHNDQYTPVFLPAMVYKYRVMKAVQEMKQAATLEGIQ